MKGDLVFRLLRLHYLVVFIFVRKRRHLVIYILRQFVAAVFTTMIIPSRYAYVFNIPIGPCPCANKNWLPSSDNGEVPIRTSQGAQGAIVHHAKD